VATKRSKRSGTKSTAKRSSKAARPAARPKPAKPAANAAAKPASRPAAPARREAAGPSLEERTLALRDAIEHSKLTAVDPWGYTPKARKWVARAERLLAGTEPAEAHKALAALAAEVEGDREFQEARRRF
jgi:hypothetical protein